MEYVEGGANWVQCWWGSALDLNPAGCNTMGDGFSKAAAWGAAAAPIMGALGSIGTPFLGWLYAAITGAGAAALACIAVELYATGRGGGGTLICKVNGFSVNKW